MAEKMGKSAFPAGHGPTDFECFGPPATRDGEFAGIHIADMGCFTQDGKDSNKYYHAAVVRSRKDGTYYAYFEWGRTGASSPQFQLLKCSSMVEAQSEFAKQCAEKNSKRGEWVDIPGIGRTLRAKAGKDCYLVRPLATRVTGLPDAKTIKLNEGAKVAAKAADEPATGKSKKKSTPKVTIDKYTNDLLADLGQVTVNYTKSTMADASLPTQMAIDEARQILQAALNRVVTVGDNVDAQVADRDLINYTNLMYGRIPKKKAIGAAADTWILSANNILGWQNDLDAFESALYVDDGSKDVQVADPYNGMNIHMEWVDPASETGRFIHGWWPKATRNIHGNIGAMNIINAWKVVQHDQTTPFQRMLAAIKADPKKIGDNHCLHQPGKGNLPARVDLGSEVKAYQDANVNLMFHGTRTQNVAGILRSRLKLPKELVGVVINGALYGPGIYWADDWKKSAQYTSLNSGLYSGGAGKVKNRGAFMFAADVTVGEPFLANAPCGYTKPPNNCHSVFGKGGYSARLMNNEWIVFNSAQHQMRYLIEFTEGPAVAGRKW